jgi:flagellar basal-body rod protein FlgF
LSSGIWVSVSGAAAQAQAVDTVANNLANQDTLGFKKDQPTFKAYLADVEREQTVDVPHGQIKNRDLYPLDGRDQTFVVVDGTYSNFKQGPLRVTQSPLDVAMDGPGFIEVSTPQGLRYTRQGSLKISMDGRLVTSDGFPVLSAQAGGLAAANRQLSSVGGQAQAQAQSTADAARFINMRDRGTNLSITSSGDLYAGDQLVAKLSVAEFQDLNKLRKAGGSLFENADPANRLDINGANGPQHTIVRQGVLEGSNVNPIEEMTSLIKANRLFEEDLKAMKTYGELMGREANDIGKL